MYVEWYDLLWMAPVLTLCGLVVLVYGLGTCYGLARWAAQEVRYFFQDRPWWARRLRRLRGLRPGARRA